MGGKSSQNQEQQMTDRRAVLGEGSLQATEGASVSITNNALDNGAITRAFDTADKSLDKAMTFGGNAITQVAAASRQALDASASATELVKDAYADAKGRGELTDKILMGAVFGSLVVAAMAAKRG